MPRMSLSVTIRRGTGPSYWVAVTCLPSGSIARGGRTPDSAYDRLRADVPACYKLHIDRIDPEPLPTEED